MLLSKKFSTFIFILASLVLCLAYTNCSPVHEESLDQSSVVQTACDTELARVYTSVESVTSCASCHISGAAGAPAFKSTTFANFINLFAPGGSNLDDRTEVATNRVIARLRNGNNDAIHTSDTTAADSLQSALNGALSDYDSCVALSQSENP